MALKRKKNLLTLLDFTKDELMGLLEEAIQLKKRWKKGKQDRCLQGKVLAMIFEKSSTRTRVSFEVAMLQLGGNALHIQGSESQLARGETLEDTGRVLSRYVQGIVFRTFSQVNLERLAAAASVPVINGLTDLFHPVQVLADLQTILEIKKSLKDLKVSYVGDGNNVANSWINAAIIFGFDLNIACPAGHQPSGQILGQISSHPNIQITDKPLEAVKSCDVLYTDTWFSMGQEVTEAKREKFRPFQVNAELLSHAAPEVMVLHCLPAHREEEITSAVLDGPNSYVWDQAENRLHIQKAILKTLLG
jgi:ornithine carbamoyltransferase